MKRGTKVQIYSKHYGSNKSLGKGIYLGTEYLWIKFPQEMLLRKVMKFRVGGGLIYSHNCTWEQVNKLS